MVNHEEAYLLPAAAGRDFKSSGSCDMMRLRRGRDFVDTAVQEWLEIARDDLGAARILLEKDK